ncbi:MAG: hypothetical protein KDC73_11130 [Ignavibacteriae bacterium]|nr:hypothetical protein [Ignavibacteriota bacterium]MCB0725243.1 hypothetical protein [Ignavibacteriota bacterium]MCB9242433.1 hypothetical protein [Ignavibacteriales bacterium]
MSSSELIIEKSPSIEVKDLRLLSINGVRKILQISYSSAKKLIEEGKIKSIMIEGKMKVPIFRIHEFLQNEVPENEAVSINKPEVSSQNLNDKINSIISKHRR